MVKQGEGAAVPTRRRSWSIVAVATAILAGLSVPTSSAQEGYNPMKEQTYNSGTSSCHVVSTSNYMGASCISVNGTGGTVLTIEELLDGDPVPECWNVRLSARELNGLRLVNGGEWTWHWHRCLEGIDPETFEVAPEGVEVITGLRPIMRDPGPGDYEVVELTDNQLDLIYRYADSASIPSPVLGVSPGPMPLVNQEVSFFNFGEDEITVGIEEVGMTMRARITGMTVLPEGRPGPVVRCDGTGYQADPGEGPGDRPDGCWHVYERSSLDLPDDVYRAEIHTDWTVEVSQNGGPWQYFNEFTKEAYYTVGVNEVQALVVP